MTFPSTRRTSAPTFVRGAAWVVGVLALGAVLLGAYLALAPEDGSLRIFTQTWAVSELRDVWPRALLIGGGAVAVAAAGLALITERGGRLNAGLTIPALVLAVCGVIAVGAGIIVVG